MLTESRIEVQASIRALMSTLTPMRALGFNKLRIGGRLDGGYVMLNNFPPKTVCLSLGIGGDVSWDLEMAERGAIIHQFDHTVAGSPVAHANFVFNKLKIGGVDDPQQKVISLATVVNAIKNDDSLCIMKMDIEDSEWDVLTVTPASVLAALDQIVVEFHGLHRMVDPNWRNRMRACFAKLRLTHVPVHVHGNNWGDYAAIENVPIPDVVESTFVRRHSYQFVETTELFPGELDAPCKADVPDFFLGAFRF